MDIPLIVDTDGNTPIYLQLKYQFIYLIGSRQLAGGQRLPAIREVAEALNINVGTVGQAYRELQAEGLIQSARGRGTYVRAVPPPRLATEATARQDALSDALNDALKRAYALGFTAGEIQQRVASLLGAGGWRCRLVFVGPTLEIARKHATTLEKAFDADDIAIHPVALDALQRGDVRDEVTAAYYVVTFVSLLHAVETAVAPLVGERRVVTVSTRVSEYTIGALASLPRSTRACLVVESNNRHSALNLVATHGRLLETIPTADPSDPSQVAARCAEADVVVHTFSSIPVLDALGIPTDKRLELRFDTDPESVSHVTRLVRPLAAAPRFRTDASEAVGNA